MIKPMKFLELLREAGVSKEDAAEIAKAIDLSIAKKPTVEYDGYADGYPAYDRWECPICGEAYEYEDKHKYCPICGQRIDWSDYD